MRTTITRFSFGLALLILFAGRQDVQGLEVSVVATNGGTFDLTSYTNFVHFTADATNVGSSVSATLSGGIPDVAVTSGTAFSSFTDSFTNGGGNGEISAADNPDAVDVTFRSSPAPTSNNRIWFGNWNSAEGVSFNLTVPTVDGSMFLFAAGNNTAAAGGASLTAIFSTGTIENKSVTFTDSTPVSPSWGAVYTVIWTGRTVGDVMNLQFTNVPAGGGGNAGLIAVVVPEPSTYALCGVATIMLACLTRNRHRTVSKPVETR